MNILRTLALLVVSASAAQAADNEVSLEFGSLNNGDSAMEYFSHAESLPSVGLRLGYALSDNLAVTLGYHHSARGSEIEFWNYEDDSLSQPLVYSAFFGNELTVGVKYDMELTTLLHPYATGQALVMLGTAVLDDDLSEDDNTTAFRASSVAPGGMATLGLELRIPKKFLSVTAAAHLEMGYAYVANLDFDELGDMQPGGFVLRSGLGVRF